MTATILDGKALAATLQADIARRVAAFQSESGVTPALAAVLVGEDPASQVYVRNKQSACERVGIVSRLVRAPASTTTAELLAIVDGLNADAAVHGILVQLPLTKEIDATAVLDAVLPLKDVDAFHPENVGLLVQGRPRFLPCTPQGVVSLLKANDISTAGKHCVIIGRSDIVGKPLANMLIQRGGGNGMADATVTLCHSRTRDLPSFTRQSDILIAAIGQPRFVTADMVSPGVVVIDVGINRLPTGQIVGDVDFDAVRQVASAISPVPKGVGPLTVTMLLENTLAAARLQSKA